MPLYQAASIPAATAGLPGRRWISSRPGKGRSTEPVLINLAESARAQVADTIPVISALLPALALTWEEYGGDRVTLEESLNTIETLLDAEQPELTLALGRHLAEALSTIDEQTGILLGHPAYCDPDALPCVRHLLRRATETNLCVVVCGPVPAVSEAEELAWMQSALPVPIAHDVHDKQFPSDDEGLEGLGYLRSGWHAIRGENITRALECLPVYMIGLSSCAPALLYENLVMITRHSSFQNHTASVLSRIYTICARLAVRMRRPHRHDVARRFSVRALENAHTAQSKVVAMVEYANLCASERRPSGLDRAAGLCDGALQVLTQVHDPDMQLRCRIRVANIQALLDYHRRDYETAMYREEEALDLARKNAGDHPAISAWAIPLIQRNLAQLHERWSGDRAAAAQLLERNLAYPMSNSAAYGDRTNLARLRFDCGDDKAVVDLLSPLYEDEKGMAELQDPQRDIHNRFLFAISLWRLGMRSRLDAQLRSLRAMNDWLGMTGADRLLVTLASV